jgi:hypothetical protein
MKSIPGQPDYFADEDGAIWSTKSGRPRRLKAFTRGRLGHLAVNLCQNGVYRLHSVHRLVAIAFIGEPPNGALVLHGDDDPTNNRIDNLRYGTPAENSAQMTARRRQAFGKRNANAILDVHQVSNIRRRHSAGESTASLAREFEVSESSVRSAWNGRTWRHV